MVTVSKDGQLWVVVGVVKETEKALLLKVRPVMSIDDDDEARWEEYRNKQIKGLEQFLEEIKKRYEETNARKFIKKIKEIEEQIIAYKEGYEKQMWVPKSWLKEEELRELVR
ncbi:hypothetical protein [Geoglobus ahangari]